MPTVVECLEQARWLIDHGRAQEPAKLVLPRIEAKRRIANKQLRTRVQFDCDPATYSAFHAQLKRYRELVGNVTVAHTIMVELLATVKDEQIQAIAEQDAHKAETLGDAD